MKLIFHPNESMTIGAAATLVTDDYGNQIDLLIYPHFDDDAEAWSVAYRRENAAYNFKYDGLED